MKTAILIAVRLKSKRLPKKALQDVLGKTLIERLIERVKKSKVRPVVLCTSTNPEDAVLIEIAKKEKISWYAGSENDVLWRFIEAAKKFDVDTIVRVTGDNPLTDPDYIDRAVDAHFRRGADYTYIEGLPEGTKSEVISVNALKKCHELAANPEYSEYMTLYFQHTNFFKTNKLIAEPEVFRPHYRLTVDTVQDLYLIREIYRRLGSDFNLKEVVKLLDENPRLARINACVRPKNVRVNIQEGKIRIIVEEENEKNH